MPGARGRRFAYLARLALDDETQLILDGYERVSWWWRRRFEVLCRKRGAGLLVTAHQPLGLPPLVHTEPTDELAEQIVEKLLPPGDDRSRRPTCGQPSLNTAATCARRCLRLFDVYQARRT